MFFVGHCSPRTDTTTSRSGSPVGRVDQGKADWLLEALALAPPKTASAIVRHVVIEAPLIDDNVALRPKPAREMPPPPAPSELLPAPMR